MTEPVQSEINNFLRGEIVKESSGGITPPHNIIQSITAAKALYYFARGEHLKRIDLYAAIEGLLAGNPPYNPAELSKFKLSHISNFNNLDARARYERGALAYWNLLNESEFLCDFEIRKTKLTATARPTDLADWSEILAHHWDSVVRSWASFNVVFNTLVSQIVKFGVSPILWPDERDWRWRTVELSRFFVEDQAQCDIDLLTYACVETIFSCQMLFEIYEQFKDVAEDKSPWNIKELANLLLYIANTFAKTENTGFQFLDMMDIQRRVQNGDISLNAIFSDDIRIVSLLYQEYDGEISHYMFHPRYDSGGFIYFADRQYKRMEEALIIFTASPGEFTIHSNRGLGHKIYSGSQALMQLDCSIVDMARMSSTPLINSPATGTKDFEQIRFYPGVATNLGQAQLVENTLGANINQLVEASQYISAKLEFNASNSGDDPSIPDKSTGSVSDPQSRRLAYKEFAPLKNNIAHFYFQFDCVIRNMTIKMLRSKPGYPGYEYAKEWKDRCLEDGVPKEIFSMGNLTQFGMPSHLKVKATRAAGDGSTLAKITGLQELLPISGTFGPNEAAAYKKYWVEASLGPQYIDVLTQDSGSDLGVSSEASIAGTENGIMRLGESPLFSPNNDNRTHFEVHLSLGNDTIRRIQQQQLSAVDADKIFTVLIPHMQEHFQALERDVFATSWIDQYKKPWTELSKYATLNRHNAAKEIQAQILKDQQQQAQTQQVLSDQQLKTMKTQTEIQNANAKVQGQLERASEANQTRAEIMREKAQLDASNQRLKINLENSNKTLDQQQQAVQAEPIANLRQDLSNINGVSPAPYNIEPQ